MFKLKLYYSQQFSDKINNHIPQKLLISRFGRQKYTQTLKKEAEDGSFGEASDKTFNCLQ